jgi:hypothetical protein
LTASNVIVLQGSIAAFRAGLRRLGEHACTLRSHFNQSQARPEAFLAYPRPDPFEDVRAQERRLEERLSRWPGRTQAMALQTGAERMLAHLHEHAVSAGAVLCARTLLETYRIIGGFYVLAVERDPRTYRHRASAETIEYWHKAVRAANAEQPRILAALTMRHPPAAAAASGRLEYSR